MSLSPEGTITEKKPELAHRVVVKNDDVHTFDYVVDTFMAVVQKPEPWCWAKAVEIHNEGQAVVFSGHYERAEFICELLQQAHLDAAIQ